ncbi:MAG: hypothetical protein JWM32_2397 [Verrucomicrobia bacterium]|nr:hypothetical protein [Verrucomicrobiota bacterium]
MQLKLAATEAWQPLPASEWNEAAARHLLRRAGWSALPADVVRAVPVGLPATLDRLFPSTGPVFAQPRLVANLQEDTPDFARKIAASASDGERRLVQREARERTQLALQDMSIRWLQFAAQPENAAYAKWILFLSDVYVVSAEKVKNAALIWQHFDIIARNSLGPAPALAKAVSRSPAMINYLDLNQNRREAPNENFARELFELFLLGEGHYSEADIKEAARAFTGYRQQYGVFRFAPRQHDMRAKTIFGQSGLFSGDDVIDLAFQQPAAATFLPKEMVSFYLSDVALPPGYLEPLGETWHASGFDLRALARNFFGSRIFFAQEFRGDFIKSPVQFYLGLVQDLQLNVAPLPRQVLVPLRQMGQTLFTPPNVRGWVGGRTWISSATLAQRRQLVESLFAPIREDTLNADEQIELMAARAAGRSAFSVSDQLLAPISRLEPTAAADALVANFLALRSAPEFRGSVRQFLANNSADEAQRLRRVRRATVTLLQSPEYQLC